MRNHWQFKGYVISDSTAIYNIHYEHRYTSSNVDAVALAIQAGCNLELTPYDQQMYKEQLKAVEIGKLTKEDVINNIKPLFDTRMCLGEFDPRGLNPYSKIEMSVVQSEAHRKLAERAAIMSFVLLKNRQQLLPLKKLCNKMAVSIKNTITFIILLLLVHFNKKMCYYYLLLHNNSLLTSLLADDGVKTSWYKLVI